MEETRRRLRDSLRDPADLMDELDDLREVAKQARAYLDQTEGHAVTFREGLARATLVGMLDELGYGRAP